MKKLMGLSMILLSSCGDNNDTPPVPQTIQGTVVGSYLLIQMKIGLLSQTR